MTTLKREASIKWLDSPPQGVPRLTVGSESFKALPLNLDLLASHPLATSPGELLAGAIGSTFAWVAAQEFVKEGKQPRELTTNVTLTLSCTADDGTDMALSAIACDVWGRVADIAQDRFELVAQAAMTRCMEMLGMRTEGIAVTVEAVLEGA
jgi:hypothetical protein